MFENVLSSSMLGRAAAKGILEFHAHNIRDYSDNKHRNTDDYPFGGGAGMVMLAQPIFDCIDAVTHECGDDTRIRRIVMSPRGKCLTPELAMELAKEDNLLILAGHYEGIDERVLEDIVTDYVSIGDYVLTGGELPAMVMVDAISRMVPGVLTNDESGSTESLEGNLLEYPQYSRPEEWNGKKVPAILLSGDHAKVDAWRREQSILRTAERRPDLLEKAQLTEKEQMLLARREN